MTDIRSQIQQVKQAAFTLRFLDDKTISSVLRALSARLIAALENILQENARDLALMDPNHPNYDRLLLSPERILAMAGDVATVAGLPSPLGKILAETQRPNGLRIQKKSVALGVVAVIYESRPNVTVDVFSLCFKTGNACILKGGREARFSNAILAQIITGVLQEHGIDSRVLYLLPPEREATNTLLHAVGLVDVCIPRGSQSLIDFVRQEARIPVIETGAGIVHVCFDAAGDLQKGIRIIDNAKTRRVSVCNALDCLLIHASRLGDLWALTQALAEKNVEIFADEAALTALKPHYPQPLLHRAEPEDYGREFLSLRLAVKTIASLEEAIDHIHRHTSGHSEAIITEDDAAASRFMSQVDAAVVYVNASTAFTDGAQFGMGAEIGISTQKLHARGPMGLDALTSYQWFVHGDGQIRP